MNVASAGPAGDEQTGIRIGPLRMRPGVRPGHAGTLFFISFFCIAMMNTVGVMQP
jgi:hypothetical protein